MFAPSTSYQRLLLLIIFLILVSTVPINCFLQTICTYSGKPIKTLLSPRELLTLNSTNDKITTTAASSPNNNPQSSSDNRRDNNDSNSITDPNTDVKTTTTTTQQSSSSPSPTTAQSTNLPPSDIMMRALGTSPRRIALSFLSATGIALTGNFLGVTSRILTKIPEDVVEASGLDTYFPRGDFKRCRSSKEGYSFLIPKEWVADTFIELAKAQRQTQPLDYQMQRRGQQGGSSSSSSSTLPDAAYGPPGRLNQKGVSESGDTNVSIIVTPNLTGFSLKNTLGSPRSAAETLLRISIAPEGSGRKATLIDAIEDPIRNVYQFEYIVDRGTRGGPPLRNISVIAASVEGDKLFTMTVVAPLERWENEGEEVVKLRKIAGSFHLTT